MCAVQDGELLLSIRQVNATDIRHVGDLVSPAAGRTLSHELQDQLDGLLSLYVAWDEGTPLGYGFVSWLGPRPTELREQLPHIPEIYRLTVLEDHQSRGIGTQLIQHIEGEGIERGFDCMGLGVAFENPRALSLYKRLGYAEVVPEYLDRYTTINDAGETVEVADKCRFMSRRIGR